LILTPSGRIAVAEAKKLIRSADICGNNLLLLNSGNVGSFHLGLGSAVASVLLPRIGERIFLHDSSLKFATLIRPASNLVERVLANDIELFICPVEDDLNTPEIETFDVGGLSPALVVRTSHPLAQREVITASDLRQYPVAASLALDNSVYLQECATFICDNYNILEEVVMRTDMVWITLEALARKKVNDGVFKVISVEGMALPAGKIVCGKLSGRTLSPVGERVIKILKGVMEELSREGLAWSAANCEISR
jgi:DNA-binding transcriptional LysR family regulator